VRLGLQIGRGKCVNLRKKKFLVRLPPHKRVMDLVDIPSINLKEGNDREKVTVKIIA
jgi:hypothetical protein